MIAQEAWDATKGRYALTGDDSPGLISAVTNINTDLLPLVYQEEEEAAQTYGGTPIVLDPYNSDQFIAHNTVMIPALQQMQQNNTHALYSGQPAMPGQRFRAY